MIVSIPVFIVVEQFAFSDGIHQLVGFDVFRGFFLGQKLLSRSQILCK
jgi:hypothetical protein